MYYYIVDAGKIGQRQFERVQNELYSAISDYHINGEIVRTTGIRTIKQLVETAFFHQATTIVAVGNDQTLNEVINVIGDRPMIVGFLPLVQSQLSQALGLTSIGVACKSLGLRRVEEIDLGTVNGLNFLTQVSFGLELAGSNRFDFLGFGIVNQLFSKPTFRVRFHADHYSASSEVLGGMIINCQNHDCSNPLGRPTDGLLDIVLIPRLSRAQLFSYRRHILKGCFEKLPGASIMHVDSLEITEPSGLPLKVGAAELAQTPVRVEIKPKALKLIVGRERKF